MWNDLLRRLLVFVRFIPRPYVVGRIMTHHPTPEELPEGILVLVKDGDRQKWACLRCPCGCGERLQLSLNQSHRPRWVVVFDCLRRPTVTPSIHRLNACRCHFWIKRYMLKWVNDSELSDRMSNLTSY